MPNKDSNLIGVIFDPVDFVIYTIGSQLIMRQWALHDGTCQRSYIIETRDQQIQAAAQEEGDGGKDSYGLPIQKKNASMARSDP